MLEKTSVLILSVDSILRYIGLIPHSHEKTDTRIFWIIKVGYIEVSLIYCTHWHRFASTCRDTSNCLNINLPQHQLSPWEAFRLFPAFSSSWEA